MVTVGALPSTIWLPWLVDVYIMLYIIWFIILIGDCHHPRTGNPVPHRLKGFTMSPGTPLLVQQLLHDGLKPIQLQISSLYMRIYIYIHITLYGMLRSVFYTLYTVYAHMYNIHIQLYVYIYIHTYMYIIHVYIYTHMYIFSVYYIYIYCRISHKKTVHRSSDGHRTRHPKHPQEDGHQRIRSKIRQNMGKFGQNHVRN